MIDLHNPYIYGPLILFTVSIFFNIFLEALNIQYVFKQKDTIPTAFKNIISPDKYLQSTAYTLSKTYLQIGQLFSSLIILIALVISGFFPYICSLFHSFLGYSAIGKAYTLLITLWVYQLLDLPFSYYSQFFIEARFGFNRTNKRLWISDFIKNSLLTFILGGLVLMAIFTIINHYPHSWWYLGVGILLGFQLLIFLIYPYILLPLFNKLTPLPDGPLKTAILTLAHQTSFPLDTIQVMDGSKRSNHSNAFFVGLGKSKRVVLYDTLIESLSIEELIAVVAHEIGHYKNNHLLKKLIFITIIYTLSFWSLHYILLHPQWLYAFGFNASTIDTGSFLILTLWLPSIILWLHPFINQLSRKFEYQADAFAKKSTHSSKYLISALQKLHTHNLSNLTPHPLYSLFFYSHPTLVERQSRLTQNI